MSREAALRKIKACAGIARSSNPNEAARALQQMQALMAEFQIDDPELADIAFSDTPHARGAKGASPWLLALAALAARVFHTESVQLTGRATHCFQFVGEPGACEISVHAYTVLLRQLNAARLHYLRRVRVPKNRVARGDQFAFGWIVSVGEMLGGNLPMSTELAIKIKSKMALLHPDLKSVAVVARKKELASKRINDYALGRAAGRDAKLHKPMRAETRTALLPQVKRALASGSDKVFIVLHLMGSHCAYWDRYPESDAYFGKAENLTGSDESVIVTEPGESRAAGSADETPLAKRWRDSYDDSIRQTDAVLDQVIELLEQDGRASALVYASDHGELLNEPNCDKRWHGHGAHEDVFASALLWLSHHAENAQKARAAASNANLAVSGKDLFDAVLEAGAVRVASELGAINLNSWFSPEFQARKRDVVTFGGIVGVDAPPVGGCKLLREKR